MRFECADKQMRTQWSVSGIVRGQRGLGHERDKSVQGSVDSWRE